MNPRGRGTKVAPHYVMTVPPGGCTSIQVRLYATEEKPQETFGSSFTKVFEQRLQEANKFYEKVVPIQISIVLILKMGPLVSSLLFQLGCWIGTNQVAMMHFGLQFYIYIIK